MGVFIMTSESNNAESKIAELTTAVAAMTLKLHQMQRDNEARYSKLEAALATKQPVLGTPQPHGGRPPQPTNVITEGNPPYRNSHTPKLRLDAPTCDGSEPIRWLYKTQEYFDFYNTDPDERLKYISFMLEGPAADWFRWRQTSGLLDGWDDFVLKFKLRFDPMYYVDHFDQPKKSQPLATSSEDITSLSSSIADIKAKVAEMQRDLINNAPQGCAIRDVADTDGLVSQTKQVEAQDIVEDTGLVELVEFDPITSLEGEKDVGAKLNSIETVDCIKKVVENECKGVVPCAKIFDLASSDFVFNLGELHDWSVKFGNLDFVFILGVSDQSKNRRKRDEIKASLTYFLSYTLRTRWFFKRGRMLWIRGRGPKSGRRAKMRSKESKAVYLAIQLYYLVWLFNCLLFIIVYYLLFNVLGFDVFRL
ncbi:hypothetical protein CASFOL_035623 [Castilleja foliolosa]|uniref:Plant heme peroxidase family profile domain-containing protein n=1 Tax=Castilleja foliolosa TaxID=1961234 RepID=A0ABD3BUQ5_9LAMI